MYRSRRNSVRTTPFSSKRVEARSCSPRSASEAPGAFVGSSEGPPRSRASASARPFSVAPGGVSVPPARRASRARASHDSGAIAVAPTTAAARPSRPAAASHRPDGAAATRSAPRASPATPRARTHATHAASASARRARERGVPRPRRIAAVTRAGRPIGRRVRARLSLQREIRYRASRCFDGEEHQLGGSIANRDSEKKRKIVCVSVRIARTQTRGCRTHEEYTQCRLVRFGPAAIDTRLHSHARRQARAEAQLTSSHRV